MTNPLVIKGFDEEGNRISSKDYDELVHNAIEHSNHLQLETFGQHNIGCRLYSDKAVLLELIGPVGQRLGAMGMPGTTIISNDSASDDVGYLNIGAEIIVKGDASNGVCNAMAEGKVMIGGSIGARGLTMTKWNPAHNRPELWVLGSVGDTFAEFNCGGIGIVCGVNPKKKENVLGYRPCVGMVGGWIYFRGNTDGSFSKNDAKVLAPEDGQWQWLMDRMPDYLEKIGRLELLEELSIRDEWKVLVTNSVQEKLDLQDETLSMAEYKEQFWNNVFKGGDPLSDLAPDLDRKPIPVINTGDLRIKEPQWLNPSSKGKCIDCHLCETICPKAAVNRYDLDGDDTAKYQYGSDDQKCIGCGFCRDICPNDIWQMSLLK